MPHTVLALDTSTTRGSVAVVSAERGVVYERVFTAQRSHNSQLFAPLQEALAACGPELDAIVVGTGPASYTGVRIGIAAAQGVAMSRGIPLVGLPSVLAPEVPGVPVVPGQGTSAGLAEQLPNHFIMCGDARRGVFFLVEVREGAMQGNVELLDDAVLQARRQAMLEAGQGRVKEQEQEQEHGGMHQDIPWYTFDPAPPAGLERVTPVFPSALHLARQVLRMDAEKLHALASLPLEPLYLAAAYITQPKPRKPASLGETRPHSP